VTGSNSVNVFLGLGLPWVIAAVWAHSTNNINPATGEIGYYVPKAGGLSLSVAIFCVLAMICVLGLFIRRKLFGGELGGSKCSARISAVFFVSLWVVYIVTSILISEKTIKVPSWL
jgi:solute carrier family 8 (sodium/calcium exchanger)